MDKLEFASKMIKLAQLKMDVTELEAELASVVLEYGATQTIGNIKASYRKGSIKRDFETPGKAAPPEIIAKHTIVRESISWAKVCKDAEIAPIELGRGKPSVSFSLVN